MPRALLILCFLVLCCPSIPALALESEFRAKEAKYWDSFHVHVLHNLAYGDAVENGGHLLDLYIPSGVPAPRPLIVCIHGGGWGGGDKSMFPAFLLPTKGYAVASINYRLSADAKFPAQIDDCRAAIDWLRANSHQYGLDEDRIGVWGGSAGAHLALLLALGYGGPIRGKSVKAACDWCGPTDLTTICGQFKPASSTEQLRMRAMIERLLGSPPENCPQLAKLASPTTYIACSAPPLLIMHGDQDPIVPIAQSKIFSQRLIAKGMDCNFVVIRGGKHEFYSFDLERQVIQFFDKSMGVTKAQAPDAQPELSDRLAINRAIAQ